LACRTIFLHFFLSVTSSLHLLTPSTWRSLPTSSLNLFLGHSHEYRSTDAFEICYFFKFLNTVHSEIKNMYLKPFNVQKVVVMFTSFLPTNQFAFAFLWINICNIFFSENEWEVRVQNTVFITFIISLNN
jgi:hypothetical protein